MKTFIVEKEARCRGCGKAMSLHCLKVHQNWCTGEFIQKEWKKQQEKAHSASKKCGNRDKWGRLKDAPFSEIDRAKVKHAFKQV